MSKQKPKTGMGRMMQLAMTKKPLVIASVILSSLAAVASFIPYIAIYFIIRQILAVYPNLSALGQTSLFSYGWMALGGVAANILLYFVALMCSHLAAFGTLYELKVNFLSHLAKVPLGFHVMIGSGKLRKITDENIENVEKFIAHQLPDICFSCCDGCDSVECGLAARPGLNCWSNYCFYHSEYRLRPGRRQKNDG